MTQMNTHVKAQSANSDPDYNQCSLNCDVCWRLLEALALPTEPDNYNEAA